MKNDYTAFPKMVDPGQIVWTRNAQGTTTNYQYKDSPDLKILYEKILYDTEGMMKATGSRFLKGPLPNYNWFLTG